MFQSIPVCPPDSIFGLAEEFKQDPHPQKVNLTVGVYKDENGRTPIMRAVRQAESRLLDAAQPHTYLPIDGDHDYDGRVARLVLGNDHPAIETGRALTAQTPGGTGALRMAGDVLRQHAGVRRIWISRPTWGNHLQVYQAVGLERIDYDYLDERKTGLDFEHVLRQFEQGQPGDAVLLHTVCHNPTGVDPDPDQWRTWLQRISDRQMIPVFDFAYQGFGQDIHTDAMPVREFTSQPQYHGEALICNSFSKNFNLYGERVGGITVVANRADGAAAMLSQIKSAIRTEYSNPPRYGAELVKRILRDDTLRQQWLEELEQIRLRIASLRQQFVDRMRELCPDVDFSHMLRQRGMFSFSGIGPEQVDRLKQEYSIYLLRNGRINVAGLNESNLDYVCRSIAVTLCAIA